MVGPNEKGSSGPTGVSWAAYLGDCLKLAGPENTTPLAFAASAPYAVIYAVAQRILKAALLHGTTFTEAFGDFDADTIGGEERVRVLGSAVPSCHPLGVHSDLLGQTDVQPPALCVLVLRPDPGESSRKTVSLGAKSRFSRA